MGLLFLHYMVVFYFYWSRGQGYGYYTIQCSICNMSFLCGQANSVITYCPCSEHPPIIVSSRILTLASVSDASVNPSGSPSYFSHSQNILVTPCSLPPSCFEESQRRAEWRRRVFCPFSRKHQGRKWCEEKGKQRETGKGAVGQDSLWGALEICR